MATKYVVTGAMASAKTETDAGPRVLNYLEGAVLPDSVDQESIDHLLDVGLIAPVSSPEGKQAGPSGQQPQFGDNPPAAKKDSTTK